jgi:hypothetical protein
MNEKKTGQKATQKSNMYGMVLRRREAKGLPEVEGNWRRLNQLRKAAKPATGAEPSLSNIRSTLHN